MASLVLGAIGGFLFGPIGFMIGSLIGNLLFPQTQQGPRLTDLKLHNSGYGLMIPIAYGSMRLPGICIWMTDLKEHSHSSGGKGGPSVTTFTYSASFAEYICEGPIAGMNKIWADGTLIYDISSTDSNLNTLPCVLYVGDETQLPDPTMEGVLGTGNVPGYRGKAYVVFDDWDLTAYGNRIPNLNFEVVAQQPPGQLNILLANYATGSSLSGLAIIPVWDNANLIVTGTNLSAARTVTMVNPFDFDLATFALIGPHVPPPGISYPCAWSGPLPHYTLGIGNYVYANGSSIALWRALPPGAYLNGTTDLAPPVATPSCFTIYNGTDFIPHDPANFLYTAGVPSGVYINNTIISADGKTLLVTTGPTNSGVSDTWYKIVDGTVASHGTISPTINWVGGAPNGTPHAGTSSIEDIAMLETGGLYVWHLEPPGNAGSSHVVHLYTFVNGNMQDWGNGTLAIPFFPNSSGGVEAGIRVIGDGIAGFAIGHAIVEVSRLPPAGANGVPLSSIVADISGRAGLSGAQIDVSQLTPLVDGYAITQQQDCRSCITPLQSAWFFDAVESSGVEKFVIRGGAPAVTIPDNDIAAQAGPGGTPPPLVTVKRVQEVDLPAILHVQYVNQAAAYQAGDQMSQRQVTSSQMSQTIQLAINMTDAKAKQIANTLLFNAWVEREQFTFLASRKYDYLEPTDVVSVHGYELRIMGKSDVASGVIQFDGVAAVSNLWQQGPTSSAGQSNTQPITPTGNQPTNFIPLDLPMLVDTDVQDGFYAAMAGATNTTWRGAALYKSSDNGATYTQVAVVGTASVIGKTSNALGDFGGGNMFDELNTVTVVVGVGGGTLASAPELAVLNGANMALIGTEIIQFKNATLTAPSTYLLSGLLRGRRGTEFEMATHITGDTFVFLPSVVDVALTFADLGQFRDYKAVTAGLSLASALPLGFIDNGVALRPYSPVLLGGAPNAGNDIVIGWTRRTRIGGAWADYTDVPLSEPSELYVLQVWNATFTVCARVVTGITAPTYTYTSAMQVTDFGAAQQTVYITVGQLGTFGLGAQAHAVIPGGGASVNAPLNPQQPFNTLPPPQPPSTGCVGNVINDSFTWGLVSQVFSPADFGPGDVWLIKIPIPATPNQGGCYINCTEFTGAPTPRDAVLSISKCGAPVIPAMAVRNDVGVAFKFRIGPTPYPQSQPTLLPSTDYYLSITTSGVSEMQATLVTKG